MKQDYELHRSIKIWFYRTHTVKTHDMQIPQLDVNLREGKNRFTSTAHLASAGIEAKMLIYSGGKIKHLKKAIVEKSKAQTVLLEKQRQEIIDMVLSAYDQLALLKQIKVVLNDSERRLEENKKTASKAFGYGLITKYEHQKIEVAQAQLLSRQTAYSGKRDIVLRQLHLLTNIEADRLARLDPALAAMASPSGQDNYFQRAELIALEAIAAANAHQIKAEKTWIIPKVQAASSLGYLGLLDGRLRSSMPLLTDGEKLSAQMPNLNILPMVSIGLGVKWDLFDGRTGRRDVQAAEIELKKTLNEKREAEEKAELNLLKKRTDLATANTRIVLMEKQREVASNALTQATKEYRNGLIKTLQLIDAENDYLEAGLNYAQAVYDQRRAVIGLLKAKGELKFESIN